MTTYHIAPDGSDGNDGSSGSPWRSITHAAGQVSAGDTVVVQDGTYEYGSELQEISGVSGTASSPITLRAADGANPTFIWSGGEAGWENTASEGILLSSADHWTIEGLELTQSHSWGLHVKGSNNVTVRGIDAHDNAGPGFGVTHGGTDELFVGCDSHHNGVKGSTTGDGDGIIVNGASGDVGGTVVQNCRTWANTDDGVDLWDASDVTIRDSESWDNGRTGSTTDGSGMGFKLGGGGGGNNHIQRCAAWNNEYAGVADNLADGVSAWNCTAWNNSRNFEFNGSGCEIVNCISHEGPEYIASSVDQRANTWNQDIGDPQFRSTDPSSDGFLKLAEGSPAIDAGTAVDLSYQGQAPDLGAHEYGASDSTGSASSSGATLYYHDGTDWREVTMRYHDGEQFA